MIAWWRGDRWKRCVVHVGTSGRCGKQATVAYGWSSLGPWGFCKVHDPGIARARSIGRLQQVAAILAQREDDAKAALLALRR